MNTTRGLALVSAFALLAGCASPLPTTNPADVPSLRPGILAGYLPAKELVDSLALLPQPPAPGSAQQAADDAAYKASRAQPGSPSWALAERDAELAFPAAAGSFSCALGVPISAESTPHLTMLLRRTLADAGLATYRAKDTYKRARPFMAANDPICTPKEEAFLRKDGAYPSGHSAIGWMWALALIEIAPDRADALAQRGLIFGDSRMACGVHWQTDVDAGRMVAAAVFAQLQTNADFTAQLGAARKEVASLRAAGAKPVGDCAAEAAAMKSRTPTR